LKVSASTSAIVIEEVDEEKLRKVARNIPKRVDNGIKINA
jgi:hypothetical protein